MRTQTFTAGDDGSTAANGAVDYSGAHVTVDVSDDGGDPHHGASEAAYTASLATDGGI